MDRPTLTVADVFRRSGDAYRFHAAGSLSTAQRRVMTAVERCRTAALGGHVEQCDQCGHTRVWDNSCGNRHCPTCQSLARAAWIEARASDLLDTEYFHVVFTMPAEIGAIAYQNKAVVYGLLFRAVADTLTSPISNRGTVTAAEQRADAVVVEFRSALADLLGADPAGVVFGRSATSLTYDLGRAVAKHWGPGDEVVVTRLNAEATKLVVESWTPQRGLRSVERD